MGSDLKLLLGGPSAQDAVFQAKLKDLCRLALQEKIALPEYKHLLSLFIPVKWRKNWHLVQFDTVDIEYPLKPLSLRLPEHPNNQPANIYCTGNFVPVSGTNVS